MKEFVKNKINIKEDCSNLYDEALEIAFFAGVAISLGSEVTKIMKEEQFKTEVFKRIIRKDNCIGFTVTFKGEKTVGKVILAK